MAVSQKTVTFSNNTLVKCTKIENLCDKICKNKIWVIKFTK